MLRPTNNGTASPDEQPATARPDDAHPPMGRPHRKSIGGARLRTVLFIGFTLIAIIPVGLLAAWQQQSAFDKEVAEVSERHLLIARNLSHALDRYSQDAEAAFELAVLEMDTPQTASDGISTLLSSMGFRHACIIDAQGRVEASLSGSAPGEQAGTPVPGIADLIAQAPATELQTGFTGVMPDSDGTPTLFLLKKLRGGRLALGTLGTEYITQVQKAVAFGQRGHSAIVDRFGRVMAHPNADWQREMKDISQISAVSQMMQGKMGVDTFYSPAMDAEMIAGFTSTPRTGWGVMVPQPLSELSAHARSVQTASLLIGGLGLLVAIIIAWIIARYLARPIEDVATVARLVSAGDFNARIQGLPAGTPREIRGMAASINQMLADLARAGKRLQVTAARAEAANLAKGRFLANMSHEFRTPLNAILGFSEVMKEADPSARDAMQFRSYSGDIYQAGTHMLSMVEDILEVTRAGAGKLELRTRLVDPREAVGLALSLVRQDAVSKRISLTMTAAEDLHDITTDPGKLQQIVVNLLSNAVKFTDSGGAVQISIVREADWPVVLRVIDNGIGIAPEDMTMVMAPFGQVAQALTRNHGGTGLGLTLTQELVDLLGGQLDLQSAPGEGTTITVRLPSLTAPDMPDSGAEMPGMPPGMPGTGSAATTT